MFSSSNRWALSISTLAITVADFPALNAAVDVAPTAAVEQGDQVQRILVKFQQ